MNLIKQYKSRQLPLSFYQRKNVCQIARELVGMMLVTYLDRQLTAGIIVETEAYNGIYDKASHAYNNRRTSRTETMYQPGGIAYVYLCYGMHHLFNVVTNKEEIPAAVLIRAIEPCEGVNIMLQRTSKKQIDYSLTRGPGNMSKAMGITTAQNGYILTGNEIMIVEDSKSVNKKSIIACPRIGVDYAGEDALLPYRFVLKGNPFVSGKPVW